MVIEDDPAIADLLQMHLSELAGEVKVVHDGLQGYQVAQSHGPWQMLVLDLRLPSMNGLDICRQLRARGFQTPILMLTARGSELDRVLGLELGADDYLSKPFSVLELQARIRALWRRTALIEAQAEAVLASSSASSTDAQSVIELADLRIDRRQRRLFRQCADASLLEVALTPREFDLLWHFACEPGKAFSRSELLAAVWGYSHDGYDHTVNSHINRLRAKLGDGYIHTVWGIGYRLEVPAG